MLEAAWALCALQQHHVVQASHSHARNLRAFDKIWRLADLGEYEVAPLEARRHLLPWATDRLDYDWLADTALLVPVVVALEDDLQPLQRLFVYSVRMDQVSPPRPRRRSPNRCRD